MKLSFILRGLHWHGKLRKNDGQKSKWNFVETLNYMKEESIFNYTRLTKYTCKTPQTLQHYILFRDKLVRNVVIRATGGFNLSITY